MCGLNGYAHSRSLMAQNPEAQASAPTPSQRLLAQLELPIRHSAEVQDLYSRPIRTTPVIAFPTREHRRPETEAA